MERTEKEQFLVNRPDNSSVFSSASQKHWWFEVLEGDDTGMRVRIPLFDERLDSEIQNKLQSLTHGEIVLAVLEREHNSEPWIPVQLEKAEF